MIKHGLKSLMAGLLVVGVAACSGGESQKPASAGEVVGSTGEGSNIERFDVRQQGRLLRVLVFNRGGSARSVAVSSPSFRGLDRSDGQLALDAAVQASIKIDCSGKPLRVIADTALFQEQGRRSAFTQGEAAWIFQAQCG